MAGCLGQLVCESLKHSEEYQNGEFLGPLHTHMIDKLFEVEWVHGEEKFAYREQLLKKMYS